MAIFRSEARVRRSATHFCRRRPADDADTQEVSCKPCRRVALLPCAYPAPSLPAEQRTESDDALFAQVEVIFHEPSQRNRVHGPVQLGKSVHHDGLQPADPVLLPGGDLLDEGRGRDDVGDVLCREDGLGDVSLAARLHAARGAACSEEKAHTRGEMSHAQS